MRVAFHRLAEDDFRKAHRWYARESPEAANRFRIAVLAAVKRIETAPEAFAVQPTTFAPRRSDGFLTAYGIASAGPN